MAEVLPALEAAAAPLLADGRLWRFQVDTYDREVERYGGPAGIGLCERLFHADSEAVLAIVEMLEGDEGASSLAQIAPSLVHMHVNRLIRSAQRAHELVLYDLLGAIFDSRAARAAKAASAAQKSHESGV